MEREPRRKHSDEFKRSAVEMVTRQGYSMSKAAGALGLDYTMFREWVYRLAPDWRTQRGGAGAAETDDPEALRRRVLELEKANAELRLERDLLKKATAYFARESR
jgi:transposase